MKKRIGIVTAGRNDFGIYLPVLRALRAEPSLDPVLIATGTHMDVRFGETVQEMQDAGFPPDFRVPMVPAEDTAASTVVSMGQGLCAFSEVYERAQLDLLLLLGDRFEMFAAATAAVPFRLPMAHLHGGEITQGAMDEQFRHAISKLSHLHFTSTERYRNRLLQLGEEPWRVTVSGAPALDHLSDFVPWSRQQLEESLDLDLSCAPLLVTFHPVTLRAEEQVDALLNALSAFSGLPTIISGTNSDMGCSTITAKLEQFAANRAQVRLVPSLGIQRYFSLMNCAAAMAGNSSSGIIEAASFKLPVVNIGDRQKGRVRGRNVLDVPCREREIRTALNCALSSEFRESIRGLKNPYDAGGAAVVICQVLCSLPEREALLDKRFIDRESSGNA